MKNTISVVIPTLDERRTIGNCINSLLNQTEKPLEIIIVDNGSKDNTQKVVKSLIKKYKKEMNIKLFSHPFGNQANAREFGVRKSKGTIIGSLDADACPNEEWVSTIKKYFKDKEIVGIGGKSKFRNKNNTFNFFYVWIYYLKIFFNIYCLGGGNSAFRKSSFLKVNGYKGLERLRKEKNIIFIKDDFFLSTKLKQEGKLKFCSDLNVTLLYRIRNKVSNQKILSQIKEVIRRVFLDAVYDFKIVSYIKTLNKIKS